MSTKDMMLHVRDRYDLDNPYQRREVAGLVYIVAARACGGRLATALMGAEKPHDWTPNIDRRTTEGKALTAAESALWDALAAYDKARLAAVENAREQP